MPSFPPEAPKSPPPPEISFGREPLAGPPLITLNPPLTSRTLSLDTFSLFSNMLGTFYWDSLRTYV